MIYQSLVFQLMCSVFSCVKQNRPGSEMNLDKCLFHCISDTRLWSNFHFLANYTVFFFILWWKESIKALCTAGALRCLPRKTFDSPCFVSEKVTCAQCSRVSRALKTMSPLVTCLWNLNINTTCLEMSHRGVRRKKRKKKAFASKQQIWSERCLCSSAW